MIDKESIEKEIKRGLRNKTIKTEEDARIIAKKYITDDEPSYEVTLAISDLLSKKVDKILTTKKYKHPWFKGTTISILYTDPFGRMWSQTKGVIKEGIKTRLLLGDYHIDTLGGSMWRSKKGRTYTCRYRTCAEEQQSSISPQTFIG